MLGTSSFEALVAEWTRLDCGRKRLSLSRAQIYSSFVLKRSGEIDAIEARDGFRDV